MHTLVILVTILESLFSVLSEKTLTTDFSVTMGAEQAQPMTYNGTLTMQGEKFLVSVLGTEAAYDGKTLYSYQEDMDELTLSHPTATELQQANPFLFADAMRDACNSTERISKDEKSCIITLVPKVKEAQTEISKITLIVDKQTLLPSQIEVKEGKKTTTLRARNPHWTTDKQVWTINKPNAFINDLR